MVGPHQVIRDLTRIVIRSPGKSPAQIEYVSPRDAEEAFEVLADEDVVARVLAHLRRSGRRHHTFVIQERTDFAGKLRGRQIGGGVSVIEGNLASGGQGLQAVRFSSREWSVDQAERHLDRVMGLEPIALLPANV